MPSILPRCDVLNLLRIQFERRGGFAGIALGTSIDLDTLPAAERERIQALVESADFFSLPPNMGSQEPGGDRFQYTVTVQSAGRSHTVRTDDAGAPPALRSLLESLVSAARTRHAP